MISLVLISITSIILGLFLLTLSAISPHNNVLGQALKLPSVKITFPTPGENVSVNDTFIFSGVSSDNSSSDCQVSIILNDIRPYQPVVPIKDNDYSSWTFDLGTYSTAVKDGYNKATAKISCLGPLANATKWNSINFTKIIDNGTITNASDIQLMQPAGETPEGTGLDTSTTENISELKSQNNTGEIIDNASSVKPASTLPTTPTPLSIAVRLDRNPISVGSLQTANVNVADSVTGQPIANATIKAGITSPSGKIINFENMTRANGDTSFSWIVARVAETGHFDVNFNASAIGYISNQTAASYEVVNDPSLRNQTVSPFN